MSKKTIVLADNSYTIRRIVELSFSDETDIELVTFENGLNLKEKLLELAPHIVLVDIKLPEFNGYDLCHFVQGAEALNHTKVFLLKGGFEPIDEGLLQGLKYEDIITKPFDSNALVSNIKKLLEDMPVQTPPGTAAEVPSSLPEDEELPDIGAIPEPDKDISFSDVKEEIESEEILPEESHLGPIPGPLPDEEILPSEEITRAQPDKDTITPGFEEEDNPFADEMAGASMQEMDKDESTDSNLTEEELNIKKNIELQEKELEIDSLTLEEINIKRDIERLERERGQQPQEQELAPEGVITDEGEELEADTSEMFPESKLEPQEELFSPPTFDKAEEPEMPEIKYEQEMERESLMEMEIPEPEPIAQVEITPEPEDMQLESEPEAADLGVEFVDQEPPGPGEFEIPGIETPPMPSTPEIKIEEEAKIPEPPPQVIQTPVEEMATLTPETKKIPGPPKPAVEPIVEPTAEAKESIDVPTEALVNRIEDKLTHTIKEMLWEIVPPLAEKIIKKEIEILKSETEKSLK